MKKFKLFINTGNAAFALYPNQEIRRCLLETAEKMRDMMTMENGDKGVIIDSNGNTVGAWEAR